MTPRVQLNTSTLPPFRATSLGKQGNVPRAALSQGPCLLFTGMGCADSCSRALAGMLQGWALPVGDLRSICSETLHSPLLVIFPSASQGHTCLRNAQRTSFTAANSLLPAFLINKQTKPTGKNPRDLAEAGDNCLPKSSQSTSSVYEMGTATRSLPISRTLKQQLFLHFLTNS